MNQEQKNGKNTSGKKQHRQKKVSELSIIRWQPVGQPQTNSTQESGGYFSCEVFLEGKNSSTHVAQHVQLVFVYYPIVRVAAHSRS